MENKINIAELLKDCPKGMELDCTMYEDLYFDYVDELNIIHCYTQGENYRTSITFNQYGTPNSDIKSKCVIFPTGKTTWDGFVPPCKFKDGDVLFVKSAYDWICIYKESENDEDLYIYVATQNHSYYTYIANGDNPLCCKEDISGIRLATEEEKQELFQAIKDNGYHWNTETKTLDKLVESKEDTDRPVMAGIYFDRENYADEVELYLGNYEIEIRDGKTYAVFKNQKNSITPHP